jgi:hypothetical protein
MVMWLAMRSTLGADVRRVHRHHYAPMLTGYGLLVLESAVPGEPQWVFERAQFPEVSARRPADVDRRRARA